MIQSCIEHFKVLNQKTFLLFVKRLVLSNEFTEAYCSIFPIYFNVELCSMVDNIVTGGRIPTFQMTLLLPSTV
jgi:hypothetical protein